MAVVLETSGGMSTKRVPKLSQPRPTVTVLFRHPVLFIVEPYANLSILNFTNYILRNYYERDIFFVSKKLKIYNVFCWSGNKPPILASLDISVIDISAIYFFV